MTVLRPTRPVVVLPTQPDDVPWPAADWPRRELPGATRDELERLIDRAFSPGDEMPGDEFGMSLAFVAIHRGCLVAERYGPTAGPDEQLVSWSMAKSITHALVGVAAGEGRLALTETGLVPAWADPDDQRAAITIDHLLRMVPGTRFNEDYVDTETSHCIEMLFGEGKADMSAYVADLPSEAEPNTVFNYSSGTTVLLCRILADAVGRGPDFEAWVRSSLLDPIGMSARLTFDEAGVWVGSSFLHATAQDFARFGLLYLRDGVWDGRRVLPEGWVNYARTAQAVDDEGATYGAHWWMWPPDHDVFYASGYETQRIVVDPVNDLVLVRLGKTPTDKAQSVDAWLEQIRLVLAG